MERIPNGRYTKEFREEAVKMVTEGGLSVLEVSSRLSLPKSMTMDESCGVVSRRWPITIKYYWFGQHPMKDALPDIAKCYSIPQPVKGAINFESWTLLIDLTKTDSDLLALLDRDTRKQVKRAEREGVSVERYDGTHTNILNEFLIFYDTFAKSKADVSDVLELSVKMKMLKRMADAGLLKITRAMGPDGEPLVYRLYVAATGRIRGHHSASLFRKTQSSEHRHYVGQANRYLHFQNMLHFKNMGYSEYDMGGWYSGQDDESLLRVNRFKEAFGGKVVCEYDSIYGCTPAGRCLLPFRSLYRKAKASISLSCLGC